MLYEVITEVGLEDRENFETSTLIWAAGVKGQMPKGIDASHVVRGNRIKVDNINRVEGLDGVFAVGDIAYMETADYPHGHPQVAQVALQMAIV